MTDIHPTAIVDGGARLGADVKVGAYCVIEADAEIGDASVLRPHAVVRRYTTLGSGNYVDSHAVLGGDPQDYKFDQETISYLRVGDDNVFREGVTISRATGAEMATVVGSGTYWMVNAHAGHNAVIADQAVLANGVALAGHTELGAGSIISAHAGIHQFCWIGEMVMVQGNTAITMHVPPYVMVVVPINGIVGLNTVGLRRAPHITDEDRRQIKEAFRLTYRSGQSPAKALAAMEACTDWGEPADKFRRFVRRVLEAQAPNKRGLAPMRSSTRR